MIKTKQIFIFSILVFFTSLDVFSQDIFYPSSVLTNPWQFLSDEDFDFIYSNWPPGALGVTVGCGDETATNYFEGLDFSFENMCLYDYSYMCEDDEDLYMFEETGRYDSVELEILDSEGLVVFPNDIPTNVTGISFMGPVYNTTEYYACLSTEECYVLNIVQGFDWQDSPGNFDIPGLGEFSYDDAPFTSTYPDPECGIPGCTDPDACNYDPSATAIDGSCTILDECGVCGGTGTSGCFDPTACNFDPTAGCDDGSCEYSSCFLMGDPNGDGTVDILDLLMTTSNFGCTEDCDGDANGDGVVNIFDIITISSYWGNTL